MKPIILLLALITPLLARIGETPEQCHARYGDGSPFVPSPHNDAIYQKAGMEIIVAFREGKCVMIIYERKQKFSDAEINQLQRSNHSGRWKVIERDFRTVVWESSNGVMHSAVIGGNRLMVTTVAEMERLKKERKAREIEALEGL